MTRRACIECDHIYNGVLTCSNCGGAGEPIRGRPPVEDKRRKRVAFSDAEWTDVKRSAAQECMTAAAWVRARCGL